jgi:AcrR family transcriptional regulator
MSSQKPALELSSRDRIREAAKNLFARHGYEATSTSSICREAGTSESQLNKHFGGKQGVLSAIFEHAWDQINPSVRLAMESISAPREKFQMLLQMALNFLQKDRQLSTLFLLEGRRIRDGKFVVLVPGFLEFVGIVDGVLKELAERRELAAEVHPQALRSAVMGAIEGMLRDQMLAASAGMPATFTDADVRMMCAKFLECALKK